MIIADDLQKDGYALIGFNSERDLTGDVVGFDDSINGSLNSPYYDEDLGCIVLYAVYKRIVDETRIMVLDDNVDRAVIDEFGIESLFTVDLNLGDEGYVYDQEVYVREHISDGVIDYISIYNLIEGAKVTLPVIERNNYTLTGYRNTLNGKSTLAGQIFTINGGVNGDINDNSQINLQMIWQGVDFEFIVNNYQQDGTWQKTTVSVPYGSILKFQSSASSYLENSTIVNIQVLNKTTGQIFSDGKFSFIREGYNFVTWRDDGGEELSVDFFNEFKVDRTFNEIFAEWVEKEYTVTYKLTGGNLVASSGIEDEAGNVVYENVKYGQTLNLISDYVERSGYYFEGWALSDILGAPIAYDYEEESITITNNTTLYAVWREAYTITLFLDASRQEWATVAVNRDNTFTLTGNEIKGYKFTRFNTSDVGSGDELIIVNSQEEVVSDGNLYVVSGESATYPFNASTTYYAMWYNVDFANGESDENPVDDIKPASFYVTYGAVVTLPENTFTPTKYYEFDNWYYNGAECDAFFIADSSNGLNKVSQPDGSARTIVFTANWKLKSVRVDLYFTDSADSANVSEYVTGSQYIISDENSNMPYLANHEIDYILDSGNGLAYFVEGKQQVTLTVPDITATSLKEINGVFVYELHTVWKNTIIFDANTSTSNNQTANYYVGKSYNKETYPDGVVSVSDIEEQTTFVLPKISGEGGLNFVNPHMDFVSYSDNRTGENANTYGSEEPITVTGDMTLYVLWDQTTYTVQIVDETGINETISKQFVYGESGIISTLFETDNMTTTDEDQNNGYYVNLRRLVYQYKDNSPTYFSFDEFIQILNTDDYGFIYEEDLVDDKTIILNCVWEEKTYQMTINLDGGSWDSNYSLDEFENLTYDMSNDLFIYEFRFTDVNSESSGIRLAYEGLKKNGYRFNGFAVTNADYSQILSQGGQYYYLVKQDATALEQLETPDTITILWQEQFTLTFNGNGGQISSFESESSDVIDDKVSFTVPSDISVEYPSKANFLGWWFTTDVNDIKQI